MSELDPELRATIAAEAGLSAEATTFLTGETVEQVEESARELAKLIKAHESQESPAAPAADLFAGTGAAKAERQRALMGVLTGRPEQRRDEYGRFASGSGFDGGARGSLPARAPETHDQTLSRVLRTGEANAGRSL